MGRFTGVPCNTSAHDFACGDWKSWETEQPAGRILQPNEAVKEGDKILLVGQSWITATARDAVDFARDFVEVRRPHRPGQWHIRLTHGLPDVWSENEKICEVELNIDDSPNYRARCHANARLIAAAPETAAERDRLKLINADLLAALISCAEHLRSVTGAMPGSDSEEVCDLAGATIAIATGAPV